MGRYKFPGKPTKHVNKKRVNVLSCPSTKSNETSIGYNESLNTSDICNTYRDNNKRTKTLAEFNMHEAHHGNHKDSEERNVDPDESKCIVLTSNTNVNNVTLENNKNSDCERLSIVRRANKSNAFLYNYKNYHLKHESSKSTRKRLMKKGSELRIVSKVDVHESVSKKITACNTRRSLYRRKKQIKDKNMSSRIHEREATNIVGKFVLPSKSLHSSRVIIPNKRFINNEQIYNKNDVDSISRGISRNNRKAKIDKTIAPSNHENKNDGRKKEPVDEVLKSAVQSNTASDTSTCNKNTSEFCLSKESGNMYSHDSSKDSSDMVLIDSTGNTNAPKPCSKLVLRKARLQLRTHVSEDMDGPFSNYSASAPSPPGTVTCGVCGAVRFYRFVKQARKFNIYSCESCRKFISKMIKRQTCSKNCSISTLVCHKGQGMCHVPPIVRSQQWKLLRCAYKARCPACWLKMCLQSFQMPSQLKLNLTNMLPENMRTYEDCNKFDIVPNINNLNNLQETQNTHTNDASQTILQEQLGKVLETSISPVKLDILSSKTDTLLKDMKNEKKHQKPRTRVASQKKNASLSSQESSSTMPDCTKRQKIDLKGPRVKHVCRSASIVLGQPIATFSRECNPDDTEKNRPLCEASSETDACINCTSLSEDTCENAIEDKCLTIATNKTNQQKQSTNISIVSLPASNVCLTVPSGSTNELCSQNDVVKHPLKPVITISADYFDNHDSESKIYSSGFGLIGSEPFAVQAVCFYCGSAGQEQLLYCACCCEPYHYYCINDSVIHRYLYNNNINQSNVDVNTNSNLKLLWKCSRCSICYECGKADKGKTTCQLCHRYFHSECMQPEWGRPNKPTICSLCLRCEDCGSQDLTKLISNLFICLPCFKLRMQVRCCALCQTFDENSNSKLVKCGHCQNIIHAECEKLTDEMYEIIHHLPLSSTYLCSTCSSEKKPSWKETVNTALRNGFHIVLRLLTRNPSARDIMKWNLLKNINCSCVIDNTFKEISYSNISNEYDAESTETDSVVSTVFKECSSDSNADESQFNKCSNMDDLIKHNKDNNFDISLKNIRKKFCIKECSVRIKNCLESKKKKISNNIVNIQNKECDKNNLNNYEDIQNSMANSELNNATTMKSHCNKHDVLPIFLLLNIKRKINTDIYKTVKEFHSEVQQALKKSFCHELLNVLDTVIKDTFPWYNPQSLICQEHNFIIKTPMNISKSNTRDCKNTTSTQNETLSALLREKVEKTVSNKYVTENKIDTRICVLCHKVGDGPVSLEGRLLYCGQDEWIHVNCSFWSSQVHEELDCSLLNVHEVVIKSRKSLCSLCKESGASICCSVQSCSEVFHYMCARVANCCFLTNKTVCCSSHYDPIAYKSSIVSTEDFEMQRPMYIHIDTRKSKHVELSKVQYLIGCLNVTSLGTFFPPLSDTEEAIIPSEFVCSRLFWSTTEPWKIVRYTINTSILIPTLKNLEETENNFTVDHSQSGEGMSQKAEISKRTNKLDYGKYKNKLINAKDYDKESINITDDDKIVLQVLENLLELICSKEVEENCDDEPQNTADILPPELKDAIFEDLPHDILDGISVQDIFPKLMSYEDIITADLKLTDCIDSGDSIKSNSSSDSCNNDLTQLKSRKSDLLVTGSDLWLEPKYSIHSFEDYSQTGKDISGQHLKRSKSEVFTGIKKITRTCNHQRSCSLTWSCKLDNTRPPNTKKRKLSCTPKSVADISSNLFMLVDGNSEKNSMLQELRLPDSVLMSVGHSTNVDCLSDSVRELKYCLEENQEIEHEKENNCRVWRNKPQSRIVQLDGADDSSSASENESISEGKFEKKSISLNKSSDEPVQCDKCQCTYRTLTSYKKHLTICASMSSSESDSESEEKCINENTPLCNSVILNQTLGKTSNGAMESPIVTESSISTNCRIVNNTDNNSITQEVNIMTISSDNNYMTSCSQSVYIPSASIESHKNTETPSNIDYKQNIQASVHVNQYVVNNTEIVTSTVSNLQRNSNEISALSSYVENNSQKLPISKVTSVKKIIKQRNNIKTRTTSVVGRTKKPPVKRIRADKPIGIANYNAPHAISANRAIRLPEVQNNSLGPTIIIQHLSSPNMMPAYVEAFQHQTGQNLQCIATIVPNEYKSTPFITSNSFIPGGFQMQTTESSNLLSIPTDGFSVIPGLDTISQSRPMLGTFIQQNRPTTNFQCGMVSTEQLFLGSVPTVDPIVNDMQNSLYFSSSPVYYGYEAIVQNTVMQSQQFVSSTLPGVLSSNSSYSATTTQVFQSSKLEPIVDMNGTSYIVVNSSVPQVPTPITVNSHPLLTQFHNKPNGLVSNPQQPLLESPSSATYPVQIVPVNDSFVPVVKPVVIEQVQPQVEPFVQCLKPSIVNSVVNMEPSVNKSLLPIEISTSSIAVNVILPSDTENKIPLNIVTPTPQLTPASQVLKPTNRVLPMQTQLPKPQPVNNKVVAVEPPNILNKLSQTVDKIQETLQNDAKSLQSIKFNSNKNQLLKLESASLKLVFQKQSEDGIYKISNKYVSKKKVPVKIAPVKKTKIQTTENAMHVKCNGARELSENHNGNRKVLPKPDNSPNLLYKMQSQDGFDYSSTSLTEVWKNVFNAVQSARAAHKMSLLPDDAFNVISGLQLLGLNSNGLRYLIEQLPGVGNCIKYKPAHKKIKFPEYEENNDDKTFRAARCEPYMFVKQPYDMFSWLASEHRNPDYIHQIDYDYACRRASSVNLPMAMRFRQLKETSKQTVGVYRSGIHGRGLFCLRDIECGEMVIEYAGEVIRSTLTDKREKYYNSKGIGCYMFRVDDNFVIDATMKGNAARFINHSCDPNCYSRVLEILGHKHILIFALRKIIQGEELTYDYKFPFEEDKIPCTCGAKRCRKYLN